MKHPADVSAWGILAVVGSIAFLAGAGAAVLVIGQPVPSALVAPTAGSVAPVGYTSFEDERTIPLRFTSTAVEPLTASVSGRVTATRCTTDLPLDSGASVLSVDGQPVVALATSLPLWRPLADGDHGDDVKALQEELRRLDYAVASDGFLGRATLDAISKLFTDGGRPGPPLTSVPVDRIIWLPAPSVTISGCPASVGSTVAPGTAVASVAAALTKVSPENLPGDLVAGDRSLTVFGITVPLETDATVVDAESLAQIASTPEFQALVRVTSSPRASDDASAPAPTEPITGRLALLTPVTVGIVPPAAVYGFVGDTACVMSQGESRKVAVVGSQLGQTYIRADAGPPLTMVDISNRSRTPCE